MVQEAAARLSLLREDCDVKLLDGVAVRFVCLFVYLYSAWQIACCSSSSSAFKYSVSLHCTQIFFLRV